MADLLIEFILTIPGASFYKFVTRSKKSIKELIFEDSGLLPIIGLGLLIVVSFIGYQLYALLK